MLNSLLGEEGGFRLALRKDLSKAVRCNKYYCHRIGAQAYNKSFWDDFPRRLCRWTQKPARLQGVKWIAGRILSAKNASANQNYKTHQDSKTTHHKEGVSKLKYCTDKFI